MNTLVLFRTKGGARWAWSATGLWLCRPCSSCAGFVREKKTPLQPLPAHHIFFSIKDTHTLGQKNRFRPRLYETYQWVSLINLSDTSNNTLLTSLSYPGNLFNIFRYIFLVWSGATSFSFSWCYRKVTVRQGRGISAFGAVVVMPSAPQLFELLQFVLYFHVPDHLSRLDRGWVTPVKA